MTVLNYSTVVNVCEDTNKDFDIAALLAQAGYVANGTLKIETLLVSDGQGGYVLAPTVLFSQVDDDTVRVSAAAVPNYFGSFDTLSIVVDMGLDKVNLTLKVVIDPVNDAPTGADSVVALTDGSAYVLSEANFGFADIDGNALKSVLFSAMPATGQLLLNGVVVTPGTEVLATEIRAGHLVYQPAQGSTGIVGLSFQVRDDGGLVGCNAADLDPTCNILNFKLPVLASLGDRVWLDANGNGVQDSGEAGFAGVTVRLLGANGAVVATTSTDANGNYLFQGLLPGQYKVQVVTPDGYKFTTADAGGNDAADSDVLWNGTGTNTGNSGLVTLAAGENNLTVDAGLKVCLVKVGDTVWADTNGNGLQDSGEQGIAGVAVKLTGAGADGVFGSADDVVRTTTTDASGKYAFNDVGWGSYKLSLAMPAGGYSLTTADVGGNDALDSDFRAVTTTRTVDLITNGSFETLTGGQPAGWCGLGDTIETGSASAYGVSGASGARVVELDANVTWSSGTGLYQDVQTTAGQTYQLSMDVAARAGTYASTNNVEVWWNGARIATIDPTSTTMKTYSFSVTGTGGSDRLSFREQYCDDDGLGGIIDNVKLVGTATTTVHEAAFTVASCDDNLTLDAGLTQRACVSLVGADCVYEGSSAAFSLKLDRALAVDTTVWVSIANGTATMATGNLSNQTVTAGGGYTEGSLNNLFFANQYYDPVTGQRFVTANAPSTQAQDFGVHDTSGAYVATSTAGFAVTIKAGETTSAAFTVDAWKEKVYADLDYLNGANYKEAAWETFQFKLSGGNALTDFCVPSKTVSIGDTSTYYTYSPIVLDLNGDGIHSTALIDSKGSFDLFGTGHAVQSGWISSGDAFLAVDANGNGRVDDVSELFGGADRGVGFAKLASFDSNHDGLVNSADAHFAELRIWQDLDGNHVTDAGELRTLAEAGIASLNTAFVDQSIDQLGNVLGEAGSATRADGSAMDMVDVYFNVYAEDAAAARAAAPALPAADSLLSPDDALLHPAFGGGCSGSGCDAAPATLGDDSAALMRQVIAAMKNADHSAIAAAA